MILAQDIPSVERALDATNSFIELQGQMMFVVIILTVLIVGMMIIMFMMQRQTGKMLKQMGKESSQQNKLITQNGLNQVIVQRAVEEQGLTREAQERNTDEIVDVKQLLQHVIQLIETQTQGNNDKKNIIQTSIETINTLDESVNTMQEKFDTLESAVQLAVATMQRVTDNGIKLSQQAEDDLVAAITKDLKATIDKCLQDAIKSTQETPSTSKPKTETKEEKPNEL